MKIARLSSGWNPHIGILLIRIAVGVTFLVHGIGKLSNMEGTIGFFGSLGLGSFMAYVIAYIEAIGGAMLILGIWTTIPAALFVCVMIGAIVTAKWGNSFMGQGGYEIDFVLLLSSLALITLGSGKYSLIKSHLCSNCKECNCSCHPGDERCGSDGKCTSCSCS